MTQERIDESRDRLKNIAELAIKILYIQQWNIPKFVNHKTDIIYPSMKYSR